MDDKLRRLVDAYQIADTDSAHAWEKAATALLFTVLNRVARSISGVG